MSKLFFPDFQSTEDYLSSIVNYEWVLPGTRPERAFKLDRVREAMDLAEFSNFFNSFNIIHIGGTKGKGSTLQMMEQLLLFHGLTTGTFTSPHVSTVRERISINGIPVSEDQWIQGFNNLTGVLEEMTNRQNRLTYFEVTWMLALDRYLQEKPDVMLLEVGMGGRLDCTNLCHPQVAVIMPISHDHTKILGKRISQIAWDKAHILKPHIQAVIARQNRWAKAEITTRSHNVGITPLWFGKDYALRESSNSKDADVAFDVRVKDKWVKDLRLPLLGRHQRQNVAVAITAADCFLKKIGRELDPEVTRKALSTIKIPGRLEWGHRNPDVLLDVAHNPASFKALTRVLDHVGKGKKIRAIIGFAKGKDSRKCLKILSGHVHDIVIVPTGTPRSQQPETLLRVAQEIGIIAVTAESGVAALLRYLDKPDADLMVVTGSFPLVGDCRNYLLENKA